MTAYDTNNIFAKILRGEIPCHKVYEDEHTFAFMDIRPIQPGHVLVVPRREVAYLFDMAPAEQEALWKAVRTVEAGVRKATGCKRVCLVVVGWEVPHVHVHLVPTSHASEFPVPPKLKQTEAQLTTTAAAIRAALR